MSSNENAKLGQKVSRVGHVTHFWNFGTTLLLIFREQMKLETSNLARRLMAVSTKVLMWGHVTHCWNSGTPLVSRERFRLETSTWHGDGGR